MHEVKNAFLKGMAKLWIGVELWLQTDLVQYHLILDNISIITDYSLRNCGH
jgi:hypothetical protein